MNIPIAHHIRLKRRASKRGILEHRKMVVMGIVHMDAMIDALL